VVGTRRYRLRILNASNRRVYHLTLGGGQPMIQIATESGLLPAPVTRTSISLAPAERVEVVIDFAGHLGERITLRNDLKGILQFRVDESLADDSDVPPALRPLPGWTKNAVPARTRVWLFTTTAHADPNRPYAGPAWTINGRAFDHHRVDACPRLGSIERWLLVANAGESDHVVHIHDIDWLPVARNLSPPPAWEQGLKETFHLNANNRGEVVEVIGKFTDHLGRYMIHCHMLEHEDEFMMAQFEVVPAEGDLPDYCPPEPPCDSLDPTGCVPSK
jgi:spore coat protein A